MRGCKKILCLAAVFLLVLLSPVIVLAATPAEQLQDAINTLSKKYTLVIYDTGFDLETLKRDVDFSGVRGWTYSGVSSASQIKLDWRFEWFDSHAVLAAYRDASLIPKLNAEQKALLAKCAAIIGGVITEDMTEYERELAIHDYIALNCVYDTATADTRNTDYGAPFSAYGCLINGKAVCQGYTEAAHILLTMAGIENYRLESDEHTWNLVKIGEGYYHLDITWDDPVGAPPGTVRHEFFNLTDRQMLRYDQHQWKEGWRFPAADATEYNYFIYNNLYANNYDEMKSIITRAFNAGKGEVSLRLGGDMSLERDWSKDLNFIFSLNANGRSVKSFSYIPAGGGSDVLTVIFK